MTRIAQSIDLGPPPRIVRRRRGHARIFVFRYVFTPAMVLIVLWVLASFGVATYGTRINGKLTGVRDQDAGGGRRAYFAQYKFDLDGQTFRDEQRMQGQTAFSWKIGDTVNVRTAVVRGHRYSTLADGPSGFLEFNGMQIYLAILLLFIGLPTTVYTGWISPRRTRRLLQTGIVTTATIEDLPPGAQRRGEYGFLTPTAERFRSSTALPPPTAAAVEIGDPLTIVHHPTNPGRHVVYDLCDFVIVPPAGPDR
jgi:hypothetical protein